MKPLNQQNRPPATAYVTKRRILAAFGFILVLALCAYYQTFHNLARKWLFTSLAYRQNGEQRFLRRPSIEELSISGLSALIFVYPVEKLKDEHYNPDTPLIMTTLHDNHTMAVFVQGIGNMDSWDVTGCQIGTTSLITTMERIRRHKWWVVVECTFQHGSDAREVDGGAVTLSFRDRGNKEGRRVITSEFGFDAKRTMSDPVDVEIPYRTCVVTEVYNRTHALKDWLTYHHSIGVDHFIIYDNDSGDDLSGFISSNDLSKLVTLICWPWSKAQAQSVIHGKTLADRLCQWTYFPDADEYLFLKHCISAGAPPSFTHCLPTLITNYTSYDFSNPTQPSTTQLLFTPKTFGSSNLIHRAREPYTVPETYTLRTPLPQAIQYLTTKAIVHTRSAILSTCIHSFSTSHGKHVKIPMDDALLIHYKAQSWEDYMIKYTRPRNGYVKDWKLPEGLTSPLDRDRPPEGWFEGTFFGASELQEANVSDTEFRDWKRWMEGILAKERR
ncbi:hypothetical protein HDV00_003825 [Rhizophlyctis rosea]|nr:hypothetical protein HDV00_003825 [Rhizophlyctis rosea]